MTILSAVYGNRIAHVNSNFEAVVSELDSKKTCKINVGEPGSIVIGGSYFATIKNSTVTYFQYSPSIQINKDSLDSIYKKGKESPALLFTGLQYEKTYDGLVNLIMNESYALVLTEAKTLLLHPLNEDYFGSEGGNMVFPEDMNGVGGAITCAFLTSHFLIYGTAAGKIVYYNLEALIKIQEFSHQKTIVSIYHQPGNGTKCIFVDEANQAFIYCPVSHQTTQIKGLSSQTTGFLWETTGNKNVFVSWANPVLTTHIYSNYSMKGSQCTIIADKSSLPFGLKPLLLNNGTLVCQVFLNN